MTDAEREVEVWCAVRATDAEHAGAIAQIACPICGAAPGAECTYGAGAGLPAGQHYPGKAHTRRVRRFLFLRT